MFELLRSSNGDKLETSKTSEEQLCGTLQLHAYGSGVRLYEAFHFSWLGLGLFHLLLGSSRLLLLQISSGVVCQSRDLQLSCNTSYLLSPRL